MDWLWHSLVSAALWQVLGIIGVSAVIAWLKEKWPSVATPIWNGIACAAFLSVLIYTFTGRPLSSKEPTTVDNVKDYLNQWLASYGFGANELTDTSTYFTLQTSLPSGVKISMARFKAQQLSQRLIFSSEIDASDDEKKIFAKLSQKQSSRLIYGLSMEMNRSLTQYSGMTWPLVRTHLVKSVPIEGLTSNQVFTEISELDAATLMFRTIVTNETDAALGLSTPALSPPPG